MNWATIDSIARAEENFEPFNNGMLTTLSEETDSRCSLSLSKNVDLNFSGSSFKTWRASKGMLRSRAAADAIANGANGAAPSRKLCLLMTSGIVSNSLMFFPFYSSTNSAE